MNTEIAERVARVVQMFANEIHYRESLIGAYTNLGLWDDIPAQKKMLDQAKEDAAFWRKFDVSDLTFEQTAVLDETQRIVGLLLYRQPGQQIRVPRMDAVAFQTVCRHMIVERFVDNLNGDFIFRLVDPEKVVP